MPEVRWPADHVERRAVEALIPYARNARTHTDAQVDQIAASIREWGWTMPVLIDEQGVIIAGHGRILAARKLGLDDVPVMIARGWTEEQRRAYVVADNKISLLSGWDTELLSGELRGLDEAGFDLPLLGFDNAELAELLVPLDDPGDPDPKEDPKPPASLADRFGVPPFSVLNAREGWWQDRKRAWLALGIKSELGRGDDALGFSDAAKQGYAKGKARTFRQDLMRGEHAVGENRGNG